MNKFFPTPRRGFPLSIRERFELLYIPEPNSGCWLWFGTTSRGGYGLLSEGGKRRHLYRKAHRLSFEFFKGKIPSGMNVLHSCDMPCCVNPDHLRIGTHQENVQDKVKRKRMAWGEGHGEAKLTSDQVISIRNDERSHRKIAKQYGVTHVLVGKIKRGQLWKNL